MSDPDITAAQGLTAAAKLLLKIRSLICGKAICCSSLNANGQMDAETAGRRKANKTELAMVRMSEFLRISLIFFW